MPAEAEPSSSDTPSFLLPAGPSVPRSHSFLPLRSGPPIYFPLPAPYDGYCLTEYFQSDLSPSAPVIKGQGEGGEDEDVSMTEEERGAAMAENYEARQRIMDVVAPAGSRGWEYPIIRRTDEIKAMNTDPTLRPAILGTFTLRPSGASSSPAQTSSDTPRATWKLGHVWIAPSERQKGLASVVITYILHSWLLRLPGPAPRVTATTSTDDTAATKLLARLGFRPDPDADKGGDGRKGAASYIWER
ncbi:uncharacterized protein MKK02DRAFT_29198 [Dioszegia hungarica]|uniref:N-acetyltransferase domain-containing protein n=1 Tax=Dioszegia hungarica TaxID=4972 RepID=A0AA38H6E6_9TREE|nr:uncharacterized protein MKK02DRAFT_29198 [Dioszegia hungarica]KAI9633349.1 hypothetical protein MKK02DRAFT_29198 [Dioszegia hungarica]